MKSARVFAEMYPNTYKKKETWHSSQPLSNLLILVNSSPTTTQSFLYPYFLVFTLYNDLAPIYLTSSVIQDMVLKVWNWKDPCQAH